MSDYFFRTEDIANDEILKLFVETTRDREIVDALKNRNPVIVIGSRGVGKSFLMRVAQAEMLRDFESARVLPIYVSFTKSSLLQTSTPDQFHYWMLAKICVSAVRSLMKQGLMASAVPSARIIAGGSSGRESDQSEIEKIAVEFEDSWRSPDIAVDVAKLPDVDRLKELFEDLCVTLNLQRMSICIDEAAHIFLPSQQRQFFTLFRDLRSPYITCNAAVYPGVTSYGETFQPVHDATVLSVDRDLTHPNYVTNMREIVEKQADSAVLKDIERNGQNFAVLAFAASGNPRILLKTIAKAQKLSSKEINEVIREYYRNDIWSEHSLLVEKYKSHKAIIDWGRTFIENDLLPDFRVRNMVAIDQGLKTSCFFWIHRDAPAVVMQALKVLSYTGIVVEHSSGIKATRGEIGNRYVVNLGCLFALEQFPANSAFPIAQNLTIRNPKEYGANHVAFAQVIDMKPTLDDETLGRVAFLEQISKPIDVLDISDWQKEVLRTLSINSLSDLLNATESDLQRAHYVGEVRSRRMRNAAFAAIYEYLSG